MLTELWSDLRYRLRVLVHRRAMEEELDAELRFHLEHQTEAYERAGLSKEEASRRARLAFGGVEQVKEATRDAHGTGLVDQILQDVRYAVRTLRAQPRFTIGVLLVLGIGIGATTATFSVVHALLLRPLPVMHPEELVAIGNPEHVSWWWNGPTTDVVSYPLYQDVRDGTHTLSGVYAMHGGGRSSVRIGKAASESGVSENPWVEFVSRNYFSLLGVPAYLGRTLRGQDDLAPTSDPSAVISYTFWQSRFGGDSSVIGTTIERKNPPALTIVGVAPPGFTGDYLDQPTDIWMPIATRPEDLVSVQWSWLQMMGRLAPGKTIEQVRAEVSVLEGRSIRGQTSGDDLRRVSDDLKASPPEVVPGYRGFSRYREQYGRAFTLLLVAVSLIVLLVCANVANLMLARGDARRREITMRMSLGATRGRLLQQLLTECLLLTVAAGTIGFFLATWGSHLLLVIAGASRGAITLDATPDAAVLAFAAALMLGMVVLFGLAPALRATRLDVTAALRTPRGDSAGAGLGPSRFALGKVLVVAQVGLATLVLVGASVLVHSMRRIMSIDLGLDRDHLVIAQVPATNVGYEGHRVTSLARELSENLGRMSGVVAASYSVMPMFRDNFLDGHVTVPGFAALSDSQRTVQLDYVGPEYVQALGASIIRGRDLAASDLGTGVRTAVINQTMAKYYFRDGDPVGRTIKIDTIPVTIVGVIRDVQQHDVRDAPARRMYVLARDEVASWGAFFLYVRVTGATPRLVPPIRDAIHAVDQHLPVNIASVNQLVWGRAARDVLLMQVTIFFGGVALLLAVFGLYAVTSYVTSRRTGEFGVRTALGASRRDITAMVVADASRLALIGLAIGIPAGLSATRFIRAQLFGVGAVDAPSLAVAVVVLVATTLLAGYLPASRAARADPLVALRAE